MIIGIALQDLQLPCRTYLTFNLPLPPSRQPRPPLSTPIFPSILHLSYSPFHSRNFSQHSLRSAHWQTPGSYQHLAASFLWPLLSLQPCAQIELVFSFRTTRISWCQVSIADQITASSECSSLGNRLLPQVAQYGVWQRLRTSYAAEHPTIKDDCY